MADIKDLREAVANLISMARPFMTDEPQRLALAEAEQALTLLAQPKEEGWRGIDSAPNDGTEFLARPDSGRIFVGCFVGDGRCHDLSANRWAKPAFWMPLPSAPVPEGETP